MFVCGRGEGGGWGLCVFYYYHFSAIIFVIPCYNVLGNNFKYYLIKQCSLDEYGRDKPILTIFQLFGSFMIILFELQNKQFIILLSLYFQSSDLE